MSLDEVLKQQLGPVAGNYEQWTAEDFSKIAEAAAREWEPDSTLADVLKFAADFAPVAAAAFGVPIPAGLSAVVDAMKDAL